MTLLCRLDAGNTAIKDMYLLPDMAGITEGRQIRVTASDPRLERGKRLRVLSDFDRLALRGDIT
jgi:hypothetical protein